MSAEDDALLDGFLDATAHFGPPEWDLIEEVEGARPLLELAGNL